MGALARPEGPGRRDPARLKALFSATDEEEAVEALIVERGREIQARTEELQATISDLERREEQTGRFRSAVEEMLRHGSAELDERHASWPSSPSSSGSREERCAPTSATSRCASRSSARSSPRGLPSSAASRRSTSARRRSTGSPRS